MDTFGRLPNDVISTITNLYHKPIINLIQTTARYGINFKIVIKFPYVTVEFPLLLDLNYYYDEVEEGCILQCDQKKLQKLKQFIDKLQINKEAIYNYENSEMFCISNININVNKHIIFTLSSINICTIDIENKDKLLKVMLEYYDILNSHKPVKL